MVQFGPHWKDEVIALTGDRKGVDVVIDPVGGDRFLDSLRSLREGGRLVVVGFTSGAIPEVKVNRLLLKNIEVVGAGWGLYVIEQSRAQSGDRRRRRRARRPRFIDPFVGARFPPEQAAEALRLSERREATGKVVVEFR